MASQLTIVCALEVGYADSDSDQRSLHGRRVCRETLAVPRQLILALNSNRQGKDHDAAERLLDETDGGNSSGPLVAGGLGGCPRSSHGLRTDPSQSRQGRRSDG